MKVRFIEVGLEEGIKEENVARGGDGGKLYLDGRGSGWIYIRINMR